MATIQSTEKLDSGLLVKRVPIMSYMNAGEKGLEKPIDEAWFKAAVSLFGQRKALGKLPRFKAGHKEEAPVIGRIADLAFDTPWLYADILITEPEAIKKFERGEMPSLSAEFVPSMEFPLLWGVACTHGDMGHFDIEKEDFMPAELLEQMKGLSAGSLIRCAAPVKTEKSQPSDPYGKPANQNAQPSPETPEQELERVRKELDEALVRIGNLEKAKVKVEEDARAAAAGEFEPEEKPESGEEDAMPEEMPKEGMMKEAAPAAEKKVEEKKEKVELASAANATVQGQLKPEGTAEEVIAEGNPYKVTKRGDKFCVLKKSTGEQLKCYSDKEAAVDYFQALESAMHKEKLSATLVTLKDSGCPVKASEILARLSAAATPEEFEAEKVKLASVPKWTDVAKSDGAKLKADGTGLTASEQVKLYFSDCDSKGMTRKQAVLKLAKENSELYKAWTGSEPR